MKSLEVLFNFISSCLRTLNPLNYQLCYQQWRFQNYRSVAWYRSKPGDNLVKGVRWDTWSIRSKLKQSAIFWNTGLEWQESCLWSQMNWITTQIIFSISPFVNPSQIKIGTQKNSNARQLPCQATQIDKPYSVKFLTRTPIFKWFVVWCGSKNG